MRCCDPHWHRPYPDQPYHQHVQHDQGLPQVMMGKVEDVHAPLPEVEETDDAHDVDALHGEDTDGHASHLVAPGRGKGEDRGNQNDAGFDRIAPGLDRDSEAGCLTLDDLAIGDDARIEQVDEANAESGQDRRPGGHEGLAGRGEFGREQSAQNYQENEEEPQHCPFSLDPGKSTSPTRHRATEFLFSVTLRLGRLTSCRFQVVTLPRLPAHRHEAEQSQKPGKDDHPPLGERGDVVVAAAAAGTDGQNGAG